MYSIIEVGGQQYKAAPGDRLLVPLFEGEAGKTVDLTRVLLVSDNDAVTVGRPYVDGAAVKARLLSQAMGPKIIVFKKHRRKDYKKKTGHRQQLTELLVTEVSLGDRREAYTPKAKAPEAKAEEKKA